MPFSLPLGSWPKITLATPFVGEGPPLPFVPGFLSTETQKEMLGVVGQESTAQQRSFELSRTF